MIEQRELLDLDRFGFEADEFGQFKLTGDCTLTLYRVGNEWEFDIQLPDGSAIGCDVPCGALKGRTKSEMTPTREGQLYVELLPNNMYCAEQCAACGHWLETDDVTVTLFEMQDDEHSRPVGTICPDCLTHPPEWLAQLHPPTCAEFEAANQVAGMINRELHARTAHEHEAIPF